MRFPNSLSSESFLADYWQKRPLYMPDALEKIEPALNADELAWLATQDDVESRLVCLRRDGESTRYDVADGPFEESFLASLPDRDWTLLVHDVDKHLPDFRALFSHVGFVADWRVDDLMVSVAAPGGGVGPHRDNYDVFLCQGEGLREWRLGDPDKCEPDEASTNLPLLQEFVDDKPLQAKHGDVLYLPPGVPHWGIARDFCITWSIGMRAPSLAEFIAGARRILDTEEIEKDEQAHAEVFYADPDIDAHEAKPGLISDAAIRRAGKIMRPLISLDEQTVARVLGSVVTDPKAWLAPESLPGDEARLMIESMNPDSTLHVHGMARIAYCRAGGTALAFANGYMREIGPASLEAYRRLCSDRSALPAQIRALGDPGLLQWLLECGVFDLTEPAH